MPAQTVAECAFLLLPPVLLGHLWPAERGVLGLRVCKHWQLRKVLMDHSNSILLVQQVRAKLSKFCVSEAFRPFPESLRVTLTSRTRAWAQCVGGCKALAHLNLSEAGISAEGAGRLARMLGQFKGLTNLNLCKNRIQVGAEGMGIAALVAVLGECKALTHLNLCKNRIRQDGIMLGCWRRFWKNARRWLIWT